MHSVLIKISYLYISEILLTSFNLNFDGVLSSFILIPKLFYKTTPQKVIKFLEELLTA